MDHRIDAAIARSAVELLRERGFAGMSMEAIAAEAGVGKPALYRRYRSKADLVAAVVAEHLAPLDPPDLGDTRAELWEAMSTGFPEDGPGYVALIGSFMAEHARHPELIEAFRENVLGPRRESVQAVIERGQERGEIRTDLDPVAAVDHLAGPFLARIFAGADTGPEWRREAFETWWGFVKQGATT
jgi:AcrR family transcriptional regulator